MKKTCNNKSTADRVGGFSRRDFLVAVPGACLASAWVSAEDFAGSLATADFAATWSHAPLGVAGTTLPVLTFHSAQARTLAPFCVGQAFASGTIPAGSAIVADIANFQAVVQNRWRDGSVKFALLAGRVTLAANTERVVTLGRGVAATGTALTEADLLASGVSASIGFTGVGTVNLVSLIGVASQLVAGRWTAGRAMTLFSSAECASWLYYAPIGSDAHLSAWFEVRLWQGGAVEILPWMENGYLKVAAPGQRMGTASFSMGGVTRFQSLLTLPHHCRAVLASGSVLAHWLDQSAAIGVRHDTAYLQSTRLVPAYHATTATTSPLFGRLTTIYTPLAQADHSPAMGSAGYHPSIGILPEWDVAYLSSAADPRAAAAVQINAYCAGRYGTHYRDEISNRPLAFSQHLHLVLEGDNSGVSSVGSSSTNSYTPLASGLSPATWATSHHHSVGHLAYLLTGRHYFVEEQQFAATLNFLKQTDVLRGPGGVLRTDTGANTTRGAAWALRTLAQACCITPDADPLRTELLASIEANVRAYHAANITQPANPQGFCTPYSDYTAGDGVYMHAAWMEDFLTAAWGMIADFEFALPADARAQLDTFVAWKSRSIIGRLGAQGSSDQYNYRDAAQYNVAVAPADLVDWSGGSGPWYAHWGAIYQATTAMTNVPAAETTLRGAYYPEATSYWGNLQPAIAYAVSRGVPGALLAYQRMTGASNWNEILTRWNDDPVWSVKPHADALAMFSNGFE